MGAKKFINVDAYIAQFPSDIQALLQQLRATIKKSAPEAVEMINYQMPAYKYNGMLVYFAAHKNHIGFYPTSSGVRVFSKELSGYEVSKGTIKFPTTQNLPLELISKIVEYRVKENLEKEAIKNKLKIKNQN